MDKIELLRKEIALCNSRYRYDHDWCGKSTFAAYPTEKYEYRA